MRVTGIERQKRHPDRVNVYVDGAFMFGISEEVWLKFGLRKGDTISPETHRQLSDAEELSRARTAAMRLLNYRMRTEQELRNRLCEKEFPPDIVETVIGQLLQLGLINDPEYARMYLRDAQIRKPSGKRLLRQSLRLRGVPPPVIESVLNEERTSVDEEKSAIAAAKQAVKRYRKATKKTDPRKEKERLARFLASRGFSWSTIAPVLKMMLRTDQTDEESRDDLGRF